jgi:hypothetical protein
MVKRRKVLIGAGSLLAGGAAATGTGAFTEVSAERTINFNKKVGDADGFVSIAPAGTTSGAEGTDTAMSQSGIAQGTSNYPNSDYIEVDNGEISLDLETPQNWNDSSGFNSGAEYYLDNVLQVVLSNKTSQSQLDGAGGDGPWEVSFDTPSWLEVYKGDQQGSAPMDPVGTIGYGGGQNLGLLVGFKIVTDNLPSHSGAHDDGSDTMTLTLDAV